MTKQDLARVLAHYDLGQLQSCWQVGSGHVNQNWVVDTTTGRYFLKRRHPKLSQPDVVRAQHALIQYLRGVNFPAPTLIRTAYATTFLELHDEIYEVQEFIAGGLCDPSKPAHFAAAACALGWYHNAVRGFDHQAFHRPRQRYGPQALKRIIDQLVDDWQGQTSPQLERMLGELIKHARDLETRFGEWGPLPELVIHGDYYADNLIFQADTVAGVVDYDLAHWCWQAMEVAEALIYFAAERPGHLKHIVYSGFLDLGAVHRFLRAYSDTACLSEAEIQALPHLIRAIWLCASLDPPLEPLLSLEAAPQALPEILALADWARAHASRFV